jgi:SAM-dependent methyltransferase
MEESVYDLYSREEDAWWWGEGRRSLISALWRKHGNGTSRPRVLEIGCGTGGLLKQLATWSEAHGLDVSPLAAGYCVERGLDRVFVGDTAHLPFAGEQFDAVICVDVLEHLDDDSAGLREAYRVCKPGGRLIATVPAFQFLWSRRDVQLHHKRRYTLREFRDRVREEGFHILKSSYVNLPLFLPMVAMVKTGMLRSGQNVKVDYALVPGPINRLLAAIFRAEANVMRFTNLPIGTSIACVATRRTASVETAAQLVRAQ